MSDRFSQTVRSAMLAEAVASPSLLSDLAGLEQYVAESYNARSFIELLQNADDAGASEFTMQLVDGNLIVANNGSIFTEADFQSICRSSASRKVRGESIGYRGIGFKSVVGLASRVHLLSGSLSATFCRILTAAAIPDATSVPLIRVPHQYDPPTSERLDAACQALRSEGFATIFVLEVEDAGAVDIELQVFSSDAVIFLNNVRSVRVQAGVSRTIKVVQRDGVPSTRFLAVTADGVTETWIVETCEDVVIASLATSYSSGVLENTRAVAHAFLPTEEATGFGFKVNADFSTDPSRTRIRLDERTKSIATVVARFILSKVMNAADAADFSSIEPYVPREDIRMQEFAKVSFKRSLAMSLIEEGRGQLRNIRLQPKWLTSSKDFISLTSAASLTGVDLSGLKLEGLELMLRSLDVKQASLAEVLAAHHEVDISRATAVQILARMLDELEPPIAHNSLASARVWPTQAGLMTLLELKKKPERIEETDALIEILGSRQALARTVQKLAGADATRILIGDSSAKSHLGDRCESTRDGNQQESFVEKRMSRTSSDLEPSGRKLLPGQRPSVVQFSRWRTAELLVKQYLESKGWHIQDVSLQNVGYDLEGRSSSGARGRFEVKKISRPSEPFSLTTNEEAAAREYADSYTLVLIVLSDAYFEIDFIPNPTQNLDLARQCRQWTWVCSEYEFEPDRVDFADYKR